MMQENKVPFSLVAVSAYELPDGTVVPFSDVISLRNATRYGQEVRLIQCALGCRQIDGLIGPETRHAARRAYHRLGAIERFQSFSVNLHKQSEAYQHGYRQAVVDMRAHVGWAPDGV